MVQFLPAGDEPEGVPPSPRRRRRWLPRIAAGIGAVAALVGWLATRPSDSGSDGVGAQPAVTVTRSFTPAPPPSVRAPGPPLGDVACVVGAPVETEVVQALHKFFRAARVDTLHADRCVRQESRGPRIVYEAVRASVGDADLVLALTARGPAGTDLPATTDLAPPHGVLVESLAVESAAVQVSVEAYGLASAVPSTRRLHELVDYVSFTIVL